MAESAHNSRLRATLACVVALLAVSAARAEWIWNPDAGWVNTRAALEPTPAGRFKYAVGMLVENNVAAARDLLEGLDRSGVSPKLLTKARYYLVICHLELREFPKALAGLRRLRKEAGDAARESRLNQLQLRLAKAMLPTLTRAASQTLEDLLKRPLKPRTRGDVLLALAEAEMRERLYDTARERDLAVAKLDVPDAMKGEGVFGAGWADLLFCRDVRYERERLRRALKQFETYRRRFPGGPFAEKSREGAWICRGLLREYAKQRQAVYYAVIDLIEGRLDQAYGPLKKAARQYQDTYVGEAASYYVADYWYRKGDYWTAFDKYEQLLKDYPAALRLREVIDREFEIGKRIMRMKGGWRWRSWRLANATHVFEQMVEHNPGGPKADDAQVLIGECYMEREDWAEAYDAFTTLIDDYPQSEWVPLARYRSGAAKFRQSELTEDKRELLMEAGRAFDVYLRDYPHGPFAAKAREMLKRTRSREAALRWAVVRFYERTGKPRAAAHVLKGLAKDYRGTAWARLAVQRMKVYAAAGYFE